MALMKKKYLMWISHIRLKLDQLIKAGIWNKTRPSLIWWIKICWSTSAQLRVCYSLLYRCNWFIDFPSTEDVDIAGPSDLIMTRGNLDDVEEEEVDSDTDDIDHTGEKGPTRQLLPQLEAEVRNIFKFSVTDSGWMMAPKNPAPDDSQSKTSF